MRSTARVGYDQNTKEYYYIPGCSHNDNYWGCNDSCYNNCDDCDNHDCNNNSCDENSGNWCEHCRGNNSDNNQSNEENPINDDNQTNEENPINDDSEQGECNINLQNVGNRCGIQAWIKNAQAATQSGERIVFNVFRERQENQSRIYYDEDTNEFVFNQDGVYVVQWNISVTPSSGLGTVYLSFTQNYDDDSEVVSRVYTAYQGINGTPNIINRSSVIFNARKNDRYSLNNASDGLINVGSLNSSIGGSLSILRIS